MTEKQTLQDQELHTVSGGDGGEPGIAQFCPKCNCYKKYTEYHEVTSGCHAKLVCNACGTDLITRHTS